MDWPRSNTETCLACRLWFVQATRFLQICTSFHSRPKRYTLTTPHESHCLEGNLQSCLGIKGSTELEIRRYLALVWIKNLNLEVDFLMQWGAGAKVYKPSLNATGCMIDIVCPLKVNLRLEKVSGNVQGAQEYEDFIAKVSNFIEESSSQITMIAASMVSPDATSLLCSTQIFRYIYCIVISFPKCYSPITLRLLVFTSNILTDACHKIRLWDIKTLSDKNNWLAKLEIGLRST